MANGRAGTRHRLGSSRLSLICGVCCRQLQSRSNRSRLTSERCRYRAGQRSGVIAQSAARSSSGRVPATERPLPRTSISAIQRNSVTEAREHGTVEVSVEDHLRAAFSRAERARAEARTLLAAGFPAPALVWAVRSAEMLMRDFVLAPHFIEEGHSWQSAMRAGSRVLGDSNWARAFAKAEEWYGPFDEPMMEDGSNAWRYWQGLIVRRRGDVVHGRPVTEVTHEEAEEVCAFADRMASWFAQRFVVSDAHPIGRRIRRLLESVAAERRSNESVPIIVVSGTRESQYWNRDGVVEF